MEYRLIKTRGFAGLIPYKKQNTVESKIWDGFPAGRPGNGFRREGVY